MLLSPLVLLLVLPSAVLSQSSAASVSAAPSQSAIVTTILSTSIGLGPGRQQTTVVVSQVFTTLLSPTSAAQSAGPSGSLSASSSSTTVTPSNLPTAPADVNGGGSRAPVPGAPGAAFGPDDNYIAAATALSKNIALVTIVASALGGTLLFL